MGDADRDCQLALIHEHQQRFEQAEELLRRALDRDPSHLQALISLAGLLLKSSLKNPAIPAKMGQSPIP